MTVNYCDTCGQSITNQYTVRLNYKNKISFYDTCDKCTKAISNFIKAMQLKADQRTNEIIDNGGQL